MNNEEQSTDNLKATITISKLERSSTFINYLASTWVNCPKWKLGVSEYTCGFGTIVINNTVDSGKDVFNQVTVTAKNDLFTVITYRAINDIASMFKFSFSDLLEFNESHTRASVRYHHSGDSLLSQSIDKIFMYIGFVILVKVKSSIESIRKVMFHTKANVLYSKYTFLKNGTYYCKGNDKLSEVDLTKYARWFDWENYTDTHVYRWYIGDTDNGNPKFSSIHFGHEELVLNQDGDAVIDIVPHYNI